MVAVAAVLAGAGTGGWLLASHLGNHGTPLPLVPAAAEHTASAEPAPSTSSPTAVSSSAALSTAPPQPAPPTVGTVALSQDVAQDSDAQPVAAFLNQYFGAINGHDYQSYFALLTPQLQQGLTEAQFDSGYRTTTDSAETLTGIATAGNGDLAADVTFTSHQDPADSVDKTQSCTNWAITLFLTPDGNGGYLIDQHPSSYHASYQAC